MTAQDFVALAVPAVQALKPYQPGKPVSELRRELGLETIIKLASNENPLGPSRKVLAALSGELSDIGRYPDGGGFRLKQALAARLGVDIGQITLGNGSNDVLELIARVFLAPGREAVFSQYAFAVYPLATQAVGASARIAPAGDGASAPRYGHDLAAMAASLGERTAVVFIANPNNPTGTYVTREALAHFLASVPHEVVVVIDEAYFEYIEREDYPDALAWLGRFPNLIVTRTFSKAYGLAGLRVGYAISSPEIADLLNRVRQPFNVNALALAAAEAALTDDEHVAQSRRVNDAGLQYLQAQCAARDLESIPSVANFICIDFKRAARPIFEALLRQGIIVRPVAEYHMPNHLRVSVGTETENTAFIGALDRVANHA